MAADRVRVSLGRTIDCGHYEFVRVDVGLESDVRAGETREQRITKIHAEVDKALDGICKPIEDQIGKKK